MAKTNKTTKPIPIPKPKALVPRVRVRKSYRRGNSDHYAELARKSVDSRIKRHITANVRLESGLGVNLPTRKRESDAGYDISTPNQIVLSPGDRRVVDTGIAIQCPIGYFFQVVGRSSLNDSVRVTPDIIDATYTGNVRVRLENISEQPVTFLVGQRIAQLIFLPQIHVKFDQVKNFQVSQGDRGEEGFGSTGQ